jgi:mitogen-activated protein kinase kinase kinase
MKQRLIACLCLFFVCSGTRRDCLGGVGGILNKIADTALISRTCRVLCNILILVYYVINPLHPVDVFDQKMSVVAVAHSLDDSSQPNSKLPSPASPNSSLQQQQQQQQQLLHPRSYAVRGQVSPFPSSPNNNMNNILEPLAGMSYHDSIRTWTDTHVARWLSDIKCGNHAPTFRANDIRGDVLLELDQDTLKEMGVASIGDRLRIINAVKSLRQKCSPKSTTPTSDRMNPDARSPNGSEHSATTPKSGHERSASEASLGSRLASRRLDAGRPAPLQLHSSRSTDLPRIARDGPAPDSARHNPTVRPLPQPSQTSAGSSSNITSTPTSNNSAQSNSSSRSNHPHVPPPPRSQPPMPPPGRAPPRTLLNGSQMNGRRTPTQNDIASYAHQPLPPAPQNTNLLTPGTAGWSGYGLPADPRAGNPGGKTPVRATSPLNLPPRGSSRLSNNSSSHGRNVSLSSPSSTSPAKLPPRPSTNSSAHPYANTQGPGMLPMALQPSYNLSPIAESFISHHSSNSSSPSPPTPAYAVGRGPFQRPNTPSHNIVPSLDDLRRKLVKFSLPDGRHSITINVADCAGGVEVLEKVLKKFGKIGSRSDTDGIDHVQTNEGSLVVDGWGVYLEIGQGDGPGEPSDLAFSLLQLFCL